MATDYDAVYGDIVFADDGDIDAITAAISGGHDINCTENSDAWNALHYVLNPITWPPNTAVIRTLISHGCDVCAVDREQWTPLHFAASTGCAATIKMLLIAGADPNATDNGGVTPFHRYFVQGAIEPSIVELFVEYGGIPTDSHYNLQLNVTTQKNNAYWRFCKHGSDAQLCDGAKGVAEQLPCLAARSGTGTIFHSEDSLAS